MSIQKWSDNVILVEAQDDPQFTDDIDSVLTMLEEDPDQDVVIDFRQLSSVNSTSISRLLKLRKQVVLNNGRKLHLCSVKTQIWGVFLITGLDKLFEFYDDLSLGLASVQIENS